MGGLNMCGQAGAKPNFNEIAQRHGMDRLW
jgi:hypothetical protein